MNEDKVCCVCLEYKKFLGRINGGKNYYCVGCSTKIIKSKMDYFKDCSFENFLESINDDKPPRAHSNTPMADGLRRAWNEMGIDTKKKSKKKKENLK